MTTQPQRLYTVVDSDGDHIYAADAVPLPSETGPGEWINDLPVTDEPCLQWEPRCRIFEIEADGAVELDDHDGEARARLMREIVGEEALGALRIWSTGHHEVADLPCVLLGDASATITRGSAVLWGSSRAELRESSRAVLWGSSSAVLWESSSAVLWESSRAVLWGSSRAELRGSSRAELRGSSSAELWESSRVTGALDRVTVISWVGRPGIKIIDRVVWIDRSIDGVPQVYTAETPTTAAPEEE